MITTASHILRLKPALGTIQSDYVRFDQFEIDLRIC